jgi:alpha-1,3-rhamnosyl/mannosyltransferase
VDAYCALPKKHTNNLALLLVGVSGWKTEQLFQKIVDKVDQGYNIIRPSEFVKDKDKPAIISGAQVLAYPSHYEGFGMPPLEALACGVPVITADNSSLPEVVGGVGEMVPSVDRARLLKTIQQTLKDIDAITKRTAKTGPERARQFSWKKSAQVFLDTVQEIEK